MNILSLSHSLPSSNSLTCVKYLSWRPRCYHSSTHATFRHMACICTERWKNWYVKQSHLKGINHIRPNEILTVAVIGIFILPAVRFQISPKTNVMPWNVLLNNVKHVWHGRRLMWSPWIPTPLLLWGAPPHYKSNISQTNRLCTVEYAS